MGRFARRAHERRGDDLVEPYFRQDLDARGHGGGRTEKDGRQAQGARVATSLDGNLPHGQPEEHEVRYQLLYLDWTRSYHRRHANLVTKRSQDHHGPATSCSRSRIVRQRQFERQQRLVFRLFQRLRLGLRFFFCLFPIPISTSSTSFAFSPTRR